MASHRRRSLLCSVAAIGGATLAGCTSVVPGGGDGDAGGTGPQAGWIPASFGDDPAWKTTFIDVPAFERTYPEEVVESGGMDVIRDLYGIDGDDELTGILEIEAADAEHEIFLGSFRPEDVLLALPGHTPRDTTTYRGYTVSNDDLAVSEDAIVQTPEYETVIDASAGATPTLPERGPTWAEAFERIHGGTVAGVEAGGDRPYVVLGITMTAGGEQSLDVTAYGCFESASEAGQHGDAVESGLFEAAGDGMALSIEERRVEDTVVVLEGTATSADG